MSILLDSDHVKEIGKLCIKKEHLSLYRCEIPHGTTLKLTNAHISMKKATATVSTCQLLPSVGKESVMTAAICRCDAMSPLQSIAAISSLMLCACMSVTALV